MKRFTVWLDHQDAYIFEYMGMEVKETHIEANAARPQTKEHQKKFYHEIAEKLKDASILLVLGPGMAKEEFRNHCEDHHHLIAKIIFKVENMKDHASKSEIQKASALLYSQHFEWKGIQ